MLINFANQINALCGLPGFIDDCPIQRKRATP